MHKAVVALLLFFCTQVYASVDLPTDIANAYFEGRTGDFVLKPTDISRDQSYLVFLAKEGVVAPNAAGSFPETHVADLLSHLVGTAPLNPAADRSKFPQKSFFDNPKANVLFVVDSTSDQDLASLASLPKQTIEREAFPDNTLTSLTTILTGTMPSEHGIINDVWYNKETGETVGAYESWCPGKSASRSASFQDVTGIAFGGKSLSLSFSSKTAFARALATKPYLLRETSHNYGFFWDGVAFDSVYENRPVLFGASGKVLIEFLTRSHSSLFSYKPESHSLVATLDGKSTTYDLNLKEDSNFVAEIGFTLYLLEQLNQNADLKELVNDQVPDFFTFGFSSIKELKGKHGKDATQVSMSFLLLDHAIRKVASTMNKYYQNNLLIEVLFVASSPNYNENVILEKTKSVLLSQLADQEKMQEYYPYLYLTAQVEEAQKSESCSLLQEILKSWHIEVYCMPIPERLLLRDELGAGDGNSTLTDDVQTFQIVLWTSVALILTTAGAAYVMFTIDASTDPWLYNQQQQLHVRTVS